MVCYCPVVGEGQKRLEAGLGDSGHRPDISPVEHHGVSFCVLPTSAIIVTRESLSLSLLVRVARYFFLLGLYLKV